MSNSRSMQIGAKKSLCTVAAVGLFLLTTSCSSPGEKTAVGAGIGVGAGAALGAVIGNQTGNSGKGALIGAALGGALGGTVGNRLDRQAKELQQVAETKRTEQGIVSKLKSDILFDTGKSELKPEAVDNLGKMAAILKKYPENILTIKGYTDSTGSATVNKTLSEKRAEAVRTQLVEGGVPAATVSVMGMGPSDPVAANTSKAGRAQNRRVEVEITVDQSKVPQKKS
jgi:outer membrane protein OmpA-like peptidoglycan-associated protein